MNDKQKWNANHYQRERFYKKHKDNTLRKILHQLEFEDPDKRVCVMRYGNIVGIDTAHNLLNYSSQYFRRFLHFTANIEEKHWRGNSTMVYIRV